MAEKIQSLLNDEESMRQIQELAAMFGGQGQENGSPQSSEDTPPSSSGGAEGIAGALSIPAIMSLMESFSGSDPSCDLILALKPLLSKERQQKADKAVKMLRLYNAYIKLKDSGMLNDLF
ncbi:MAG: hypothetical protein ACI4J6_06920 [Oscillospiraceae bacterium]